MTLHSLLAAIDESPIYQAAVVFYGAYPITMAILWVVMAVLYFRRREGKHEIESDLSFTPFVSIIIPAFEEEHTIGRTIDALLQLDYPEYEIIVVNDGSQDGTAEAIRQYLPTNVVRLVDKAINEGKAMALNDALPVCRGEILLFLDSDIIAMPDILRVMVPHFAAPRTGIVTGNPRVGNRGSLLRDLQTLEFTSIISVQRRAQRIWGRILTASGAVMAVRRTALLSVGGFSPEMATEDIDMTWKLQRKFWDVRYEPRALVWMQVPPSLPELWKQRRRWARGLAQVLKRHCGTVTKWRERRMWFVFYEACASIVWAYTFLFVTLYWIVAHLSGYSPHGSSPIPNLWGMLIGSACLIQLFTGGLMDRRYDENLMRYFPVAILYPLIYWMLMATITSIYTIDAFVRRPPQVQTWKIRRVRAR